MTDADFTMERLKELAGLLFEEHTVQPGLADVDKLPNIGVTPEPQQDVMPKVQVLEELDAVLGEVLSETADEAWYQGAKYLADALKDRIEGL